MKKLMLTLLLLCAFMPVSAIAKDKAPSVEIVKDMKSPLEGLWLTANERSVIEVKSCMKGLCGNIYWIIEGGMQMDSKNPDMSKRKTPMCGLPILWGFKKDTKTEWEGGQIYKADDGEVYSAEMELLNENTLKVRGYVGFSFLGKSQEWTRVNAEDYKKCQAQ